MKKRRIIIIGICLVIGIGGYTYMDREKDKQELLHVQNDLANYLYNNYRIYTKNEVESKKVKDAYNGGKGSLTEKEYLEKMKNVREYSDIEKIEFTKLSTSPMGFLQIHFIVNDKLLNMATLSTKLVDTDEWLYNILEDINNESIYFLEKKEQTTNFTLSKENIIYYGGVLD